MAVDVDVTLEFDFRGRRFTDAAKGLEVFAKQLGRNVELVPRELQKAMKDYLEQVRRALIQRHSRKFSNPTNVPATGEKNLLRRSGSIAGIRVLVGKQKDINQLTGSLVIPFPISIHERGATIRAKKAQFLTIPLPAALDARGLPRRASARAWDNTFVKRSKRGNLLIFQKRGVELVPLYLLKREVTLPPRLEAEKTLIAGAEFFVDQAVDRVFRILQKGL